MARGLAAVVRPADLAVVVNVGDDDLMHGVHVSADLDTVTYTLAGIEGPHGWGIAEDSFTVMDALDDLGENTTFRIGDTDLATCLLRTAALATGEPLSSITRRICAARGVRPTILPATDDRLRTKLLNREGTWLDFQEYFVLRRSRDEVVEVRYEGADAASPGPGVLEAISDADVVVVAPSNPPLSIEPILAVPGLRSAVEDASRVIAVSPLFDGKALKGPADRVMASLGLPPGNAGVLAAYEGLLSDLVVDTGDAADVEELAGAVAIHATDTHIRAPEAAARFAEWLLDLL